MSDLQSSICGGDLESQKELQEGRWTDRQNAAYIVFLQLNKTTFRRKQKRRVHKFYKKMSNIIKTRTPVQCRSHHQKLQSKYQYSNRIISKYKENQDLSLYYQQKCKLEPVFLQTPLQSLKNAVKEQKSIQVNQFAIQTDFQGIELQFISAQDFLRFQQGEKEAWNGNNHYNYVFAYQYPSCIPPTHIESECKIQEIQGHQHYRVHNNQQERPYL